ncbi:MAG: hypothetical protein LUC43_02975 [Burkholderiales bacterium]|nr:hypothetical protein [Burkholderiales bacterium]
MAASVSSNSPRLANTITERVIPSNTITEKVIPSTAVPARTTETAPYTSSQSSDALEEEVTRKGTTDPFTGRKLVPAKSSPVNINGSIQQKQQPSGRETEKEIIADELAEGVEGMAVGSPGVEEGAENGKPKPKVEEKEEDKEPSVMDLPPFAERYPPETITSTERAEEVIEAYKHELGLLNKWHSQAERPCYRSFFVNWCLSKAKERVREKKNAAKAVWVVARDFIRKEKSDKAVAERIRKDKERAELVARIEAQAPKPKGTGLVSSAPDADIDTRGMMTVNDGRRTDVAKEAQQQPVLGKQSQTPKESAPSPAPTVAQPNTTQSQPAQEPAKAPESQLAKEAKPAQEQPASSGQKLNLVEPRELTLEQEEANELEYERREQAREERVQKAEEEEPTPPSSTEEERAAQREERRKAAEQKRQENIRKRQKREQDYEKQMQLRKEQNEKNGK